MAISSSAIVKAINNPHIELVRAPGKDAGYWYFVYDDGGKIYETVSVYCMFLNQMEFARWVEIGKDFVKLVEEKIKERNS